MTITALGVRRRDPARSNSTGLLAGATGGKGETGRGYVSAALDGSYNLVLTASDGTTVNLGNVRGPQGTGVTIKGSVGSPGGLPASGATLGDTYLMTGTGAGYAAGDGYVYTAAGNDAGPGGNWHNFGQVRGPQGLSAYQVWLAAGNTGSVADYQGTLKGDAGRGYVSAALDANYNLILTASDGTTVNVGNVRGPQGGAQDISGKLDKTGGTVTGPITAGDSTQVYPLGVALTEANASGSASRRATMDVGSAWQIGQDTYANGNKDFFLYGLGGAGLAFSVDPVSGVFAFGKTPTVGGLPAWSDTLLGGDATARLNLVGMTGASRTLESFGPCGNGSVAEDHAAFAAAQAWCNTKNTTLILSAGKRYILDFQFAVTATAPRLFAPKFRLEAWGAEVKFTAAGAAFLYLGAWYVDKQQQEYCSFSGGVFIPSNGGNQAAIQVDLKFNPSQFFKSCDILCVEGRCDNMNDPSVYWSSFISLNNVWNAGILGVTANQPFTVYKGVMILITGLSAAIRMFHCNGCWWDTGCSFGYASLVGCKGSAGSGTLLSGEIVTGSKSGTKAYVCAVGAYAQGGVTYNLIVDGRFGGTGDFDQGGETLTGATTGATYTLAAGGTALVVIPGETIYASGGEFVDVNVGFAFTCPAAGTAAVRAQIGHQINNWHVNSRVCGIYCLNVYQVQVSGGLLYSEAAGCIGVYINGGGDITLAPTLMIQGQGKASTYGIVLANSVTGCRLDATVKYCAYGINVPDGGQINNDFGLSFAGCNTDINNGAPVLPAANGNSWYRTVSRQATYVGGYNK